MSLIQKLGELLHVREDEVEAVLRHDEQRARSTVRMQRRGFLGAAAALAAAPFVPRGFIELAGTPWMISDIELMRLVDTSKLPNGALYWVNDQSILFVLDKGRCHYYPDGTVVNPALGSGRWLRLGG